MADKKISQLTAASTPLAGTEVLPIVQGSSTVKVAVSDLTEGRAISATEVTLTTGNLIIGTSGKGIDFSATPGTGTSELLADYEEGTWTPTLSDGTNTATVTSGGTYIKIGNQVTLSGNLTLNNIGSVTGGLRLGGFPFTVKNNENARGSMSVAIAKAMSLTAGYSLTGIPAPNGSFLYVQIWNSSGGTNDLTGASGSWSTNGYIYFTVEYFV